MSAVRIERWEEYQIGEGIQAQIAALLARCFPGYPAGRSYFKQLPSFRFLAMHQEGLVGHLAVEHRMIQISGMSARIFGVADLCVEPDFQGRQTGSRLLANLEREALQYGLDFIVLMGEKTYYERLGFTTAENPCRWLSIRNHETIGLMQRRLPGQLLYKPLGEKKWREGLVDFLGYMF